MHSSLSDSCGTLKYEFLIGWVARVQSLLILNKGGAIAEEVSVSEIMKMMRACVCRIKKLLVVEIFDFQTYFSELPHLVE